jgi:hypothetical protein
MEYVILVNRTSKALEATWDGKRYKLQPGDNPLPRAVAEAAKRQNPIKGTGKAEWDMDYLVGIKEFGDPLTPVEQSSATELYDPNFLHAGKLAAGYQVVIVPGNGMATVGNVRAHIAREDGPAAQASSFVYNESSPRTPELP